MRQNKMCIRDSLEVVHMERTGNFPVRFMQMKDRQLFADINQAQQAGKQLGNHSGPAGACNPHMEYQDTYIVQDDIENTGDHQE